MVINSKRGSISFIAFLVATGVQIAGLGLNLGAGGTTMSATTFPGRNHCTVAGSLSSDCRFDVDGLLDWAADSLSVVGIGWVFLAAAFDFLAVLAVRAFLFFLGGMIELN